MGQKVTFVTVGKLRGQTVELGPPGGNRYQFVNGEMKVNEEDAGLVARALQFYCAFPKGDAEPYHLAICEKLGLDPDTLGPVGAKKPEPAPEPEPETEPEPEPEPEVPQEEESPRMKALREVLEGLDQEDLSNFTSSGKPSLPVVKKLFGKDVSRGEVDAVWNSINDA